MPDDAAQFDLWEHGDAWPLDHQLIRARVVDGIIEIPSLPSANTRIQVCVRGEGGRLRSIDQSAMTIYIGCTITYGASALIVFDQTVVRDGTEVFVELVTDMEEMTLYGRGWADDAEEKDAGFPDYDSFMSVFEQE